MSLLGNGIEVQHFPTMLFTVNRNLKDSNLLDLLISVDTDENDLNRNPQQVHVSNVQNSNLSLSFEGFDNTTLKDEPELEAKSISGKVYLEVKRRNNEKTELVLLHEPQVIIPNKVFNKINSIVQIASDIRNKWQDRFSEEIGEFTRQISVITGTSNESFAQVEPKPFITPRSITDKTEIQQKFVPQNGNQIKSRPLWFWILMWVLSFVILLALILGGKVLYDKYNQPDNPLLDPNTQALVQQQAEQARLAQQNVGSASTVQADSENDIQKETMNEFGLEEGVNLNQ